MDAISFWIQTKQAPCLFKFQNLYKAQNEELVTKAKHYSPSGNFQEVPSPRKKKKRKLPPLDDSISSGVQENIYFETSQQQIKTQLSSCNTKSFDSDVEFNIKNTSMHTNRRKLITQRKTDKKDFFPKSGKIIASTPKASSNLRRSLRNNNLHLNSSFEIFSKNEVINEMKEFLASPVRSESKSLQKLKQTTEIHKDRDTRGSSSLALVYKSKKYTKPNGDYEDVSDISGFTANYIRSTKVNSTKTPRKLKSKINKELVKQSQLNVADDVSKRYVCLNNSLSGNNANVPALNCSIESSQNNINLFTPKKSKTKAINSSTSVLKFLPNKSERTRRNVNNNLNISFQSKSSSNSRYPKRLKNVNNKEALNNSADSKRSYRSSRRKSNMLYQSDKKDYSNQKFTCTKRSGKCVSVTVQHDDSLLFVSDPTDVIGSTVTLNVASPRVSATKKCITSKTNRTRQFLNRSKQSGHKVNSTDRSGFAACFSDSDDDKPVKLQRFFS